jgi:hypothetical protein
VLERGDLVKNAIKARFSGEHRSKLVFLTGAAAFPNNATSKEWNVIFVLSRGFAAPQRL